MVEESNGLGSICLSSKERKKLAKDSHTFNKKIPDYQKYFE
jgi:hypothetical protein